MMLRIVVLASLALVPLAPLSGAAVAANCVTTASGVEACGSVTQICGVGTGTGTATGSVTWRLVVTTWWSGSGDSGTMQLTAPAAVLAAQATCGIPGCGRTSLYADGALVDTQTICQE